MPETPSYLTIGDIMRPHGLRGDVRVRIHTSYPERFKQLKTVAVGRAGGPLKTYTVQHVRLHQEAAILKLAGIDDRESADSLRQLAVFVPIESAVPLEADEYYHYQLIGLRMETAQGEYLGEVTEIIETGANDVYVVRGGAYGEVLIPAIQDVVQHIDLEAQQIIITPLPGLLTGKV